MHILIYCTSLNVFWLFALTNTNIKGKSGREEQMETLALLPEEGQVFDHISYFLKKLDTQFGIVAKISA